MTKHVTKCARPCARTLVQVCALVLLCLPLGSACQPETALEPTPEPKQLVPMTLSAWRPYAPEDQVAGHDLTHWAKEWVRWSNAATNCDDDPAYDVDGSLCAMYQDPQSPMFFLQSGDPKTVRTKCVVPQGKSILVPLVGFYVDNAGRDTPVTESELEQEANAWYVSMRDLSLLVDKQPIGRELTSWNIAPVRGEYDVPPEPNVYSCSGLPGVTGKVSPAYVGGAFVVFPAPAPGDYSFQYGGGFTADGSDRFSLVNATFTVQ